MLVVSRNALTRAPFFAPGGLPAAVAAIQMGSRNVLRQTRATLTRDSPGYVTT